MRKRREALEMIKRSEEEKSRLSRIKVGDEDTPPNMQIPLVTV
jgi:hypothetical protein